MSVELWIAILGAIIAIAGTVPQLIEKFYHLPDLTPKEIFEISKGKRLVTISFFIVLVGSAISFLSSWNSISEKEKSEAQEVLIKKKNQELNDSLFKSQALILQITRNQLDTTKSILSLSQKLLKSQSDLDVLQNNMIGLQINSYKKLSGELNGAEAIPLVTGRVWLKDFHTDNWDGYVGNPEYDLNNHNWLLDLYIKNIGSFPVKNIYLSQQASYPDVRSSVSITQLPTIDLLRQQQQICISSTPIAGNKAEFIQPTNYSIHVKWEVEYDYQLNIYEDFKSVEYYRYKGVQYYDISQFIKNVQKDLKRNLLDKKTTQ